MSDGHTTLEDHLGQWNEAGGRADVAATVLAMASAAARLAREIAIGPLAGEIGAVVGSGDAGGGDQQKRLDVEANTAFRDCLLSAPVAVFGSEEQDEAEILDASRPLAVAIDPLDGSSNIETNVSIGTIFAIFPVPVSGTGGIESALMQPGREQLAAGFFIYGPQTARVLTVKAGTHAFTPPPRAGTFRLQGRADGGGSTPSARTSSPACAGAGAGNCRRRPGRRASGPRRRGAPRCLPCCRR